MYHTCIRRINYVNKEKFVNNERMIKEGEEKEKKDVKKRERKDEK